MPDLALTCRQGLPRLIMRGFELTVFVGKVMRFMQTVLNALGPSSKVLSFQLTTLSTCTFMDSWTNTPFVYEPRQHVFS